MARFGLIASPQSKLREAEFFLARLREERTNREVAGFYLSAFLSAARSCADHLETDYANRPGFRGWWDHTIKPQIAADPVFARLNSQRNFELHQRRTTVVGAEQSVIHVEGRIHSRSSPRVPIPEAIQLRLSHVGILLRRQWLKVRHRYVPPIPPYTESWFEWLFDDQTPVIPACEETLRKVRGLVDQVTARWR